MNNLITSDQSAYRNQHNTQTALHRVVDDWLYNISDGNLTGVCSFDITMAVFIPQLWDRNGSGTQPGARVHTCYTASGRSGRSRPPRDVIAVERFRNGSGWLCGVDARLDPFRNRSSCP